MPAHPALCDGTNQDGSPCTRHHAEGRPTCRWHHPEVLEERARRLEEQAAEIRAALVSQ